MDEYDSSLNKVLVTFKEEEKKKVVDLYVEFFKNSFKDNIHLKKALITGILRIAKYDLFSGINNITESGMYSIRFSQFYGFSEEEFNSLCLMYNVPKQLKETMKNWYNGYRIKNIKIYNPWSVMYAIYNFVYLNFPYTHKLESEVIKNYWVESGSFSFLDNFFEIPEIIKDIESLCDGNSIQINYNNSISFNDFNSLNQAISSINKNDEFLSTIKKLFFSFLYSAGYLTSDGTSLSNNNSKLKLYLINKFNLLFKFILNIYKNSKHDYSQQ